MDQPGTYTLDAETLMLNAYRLLCLFYANKEIARLSDPSRRDDPASRLEQQFFDREVTTVLLNIAVGLRVLDDQMKALPVRSPARIAYITARDEINSRHSCMMFDDMSLRETCNKIIHATTVEPHSAQGAESHEIDSHNWLSWADVHDQSPDEAGPEPEPIEWHHLSGHIRLGGQQNNKQWWHLLDVPVFVEAICGLLELSGREHR
jgi:hypothetical protein